MKTSISLFIITLFLFYSCNDKEQNKSSATSESSSIVNITDSTDLYVIKAQYPQTSLDSKNSIKEYVTYLLSQKKEEWKHGGKVYQEEMKIRKQFPQRKSMKYEYDISFKTFTSKKHHTFTYLFNVYTYTGGANGENTVNTFTFQQNKKEGNLLKIEDILELKNNKDIAITKLLAAEAAKNPDIYVKDILYQGLGLTYLKADGITLDKEKCKCDSFFFGSNLQNFIVTDSGISFVFNKGDIAIGAAGTPKISLTWNQLKPYVISEEFKN